MRRYLAEFIGTFFLVLTIVTTVLSGSALAPLAIGGVLTAMVFAGGHISGAHYNPAVSVAVWVRGRIPAMDLPGYLLAQITGGLLGALSARAIAPASPSAALSLHGDRLLAALAAELLMTFALAYVVLNVATSSEHPNNSFYGLAIGLTVTTGAISFGGISGGVFNPAVALGVMSAGLVSWSMLWVYLTANLVGGALAGLVFRMLNPHEWTIAAADVSVLPSPRAESDTLTSV